MALKIALYDTYELALLGMQNTIKSIHDFEVVGAFSNEEELMEFLKSHEVDIIVLDLMLKSSQGLTFIEGIKSIQNDIKIIVLSEATDELVIKREIELGVSAILRKDTSYSELVNSITSVSKGNGIYPDAVIEKVNSSILSEMELNVLQRIADEFTNDEIAKEFFISRRTVESHVSSICEKLGVTNRIGAVRKAIELGLLK